jgi:hypothetical protein
MLVMLLCYDYCHDNPPVNNSVVTLDCGFHSKIDHVHIAVLAVVAVVAGDAGDAAAGDADDAASDVVVLVVVVQCLLVHDSDDVARLDDIADIEGNFDHYHDDDDFDIVPEEEGS